MAVTVKHDERFVKFVKEYIGKRLDELEGLDTYGCDLGHELSLDVNNDVSLMWDDDDDALDFISEYSRSALATVDCVKWHMGDGEVAHMLKDWRTFAFFMLWEGCNCIASQLPTVEEHWNDEFELTEDVVTKLKAELASVGDIEY